MRDGERKSETRCEVAEEKTRGRGSLFVGGGASAFRSVRGQAERQRGAAGRAHLSEDLVHKLNIVDVAVAEFVGRARAPVVSLPSASQLMKGELT